ncbi:MAG: NADH-quinone oxidoreductase subunit C [Methanosarcinaceae archaeon]|nr:NADH-quinone oxidoreductase subunit C [Methanosarcinaceae archaeon]
MNAQDIIDSLMKSFTGTISNAEVVSDIRVSAYLDKEREESVKTVCQYLKDELGFDHLSNETAVDYIQKGEIEVIYHIASYDHPVLLTLKVRLPRDAPVIESIVPVYWNANWYEREIYELFGVKYTNHPDLRQLILPDDMLGDWPLRKDYEGFPNRTANNLV